MNLFGIRTERIHLQSQKCPLGELKFEELEGLMMPWRTYIVCLMVLLQVLLGSCEGAPGPGWKEQTDWKEEGDRGGPPRRGPHLLPGLPTNISVTAGGLATLPCRVANLKRRAVSWIRQEDLKVLATDDVTFTSDTRLQVRAWRTGAVWAWDLEIHEATIGDAGVYECQVNTRPKISHPVTLHVHTGGAVIPGPTEVYVEAGSRLLLTCWVQAPPRPPGPITWLHDLNPIHAHGDRGGVSLHVAQEGAKASTRLSLTSVTPRDAGNYTCQPEGLEPAHVTVFVLQDEEPRAMHHDEASCNRGVRLPLLFLVLLFTHTFR